MSIVASLGSSSPLSALYWFGFLRCAVSEEDVNARQALLFFQEHAHVLWKTGKRRNSSPKALFQSLFSKDNSQAESSSSSSSSEAQAKLLLNDDDESSDPQLFLEPLPNQSISYSLGIALRRVDKLVLEENDIVLLAKPPKLRQKGGEQQPPKELLRFVLLQSTNSSEATPDADASNGPQPASDELRNLAFHHLSVLVEWERQRRLNDDNIVDDDDDDENASNFLTARAQKAAYFCQRELELQQKTKSRQERKDELLRQSGGLKYTAIAMANNSSSKE